MLPPGAPFKSHARHGILATAVLLALVLVFTTWTAWRDAEMLVGTLCEGQSELFLRALKHQTGPRHPTEADFQALLERYADEGLRGAGLLKESTIHAFAGTITEPYYPSDNRARGRHLRRVGDLYQVIAPPPEEGPRPPPPPDGIQRPPPPMGRGKPPPPPGGRPPFGDEPPPPPHEGEPPPPHPGEPAGAFPPPPEARKPVFVFEFEPLLATGLLRRERQTFALATGAAVLLVFAAFVLWLRGAREEALVVKLAQSERLVALGTMSAVLAHEIKNPLAALKGNAQLVAESLTTDARSRGQANRVVEAAVRLQGLVQNLLDFARGGAIERVEADPAELLFLAAEDAAPTAKLELDDAPATWSLDVIRIRQVLENLLRNAVQASKNGLVSASVALEGDALVYTVYDNGPGFPDGTAETIFEPFFTTKSRGVGLGLAVARRVVTMHGGEIKAKNRPEGGAELRVSIPRA